MKRSQPEPDIHNPELEKAANKSTPPPPNDPNQPPEPDLRNKEARGLAPELDPGELELKNQPSVPPEPILAKFPSVVDVKGPPDLEANATKYDEVGKFAYELYAHKKQIDGGLPLPVWSGITESEKRVFRFVGAVLTKA